MNGFSGTYAVNGTNFLLQPSVGNWVVRNELGRDGNNKPIYPAIRDYELQWDLIDSASLNQLINMQQASVTGAVVVDLPKWGDANYLFYSYSGTVVDEPTVGEYFMGYSSSVKLILRNIRTN
jgi:hypothetical protein